MRHRAWLGGVLLGLVLWMGCSARPQEIDYGRDLCTFCKMAITDPRYAAEIVTQKGRVYKFDSIECMIAATLNGTVNPSDVKAYWVKDWQTQKWIQADKAYYLQSTKLRSPMGLNISAFATRKEMEDAKQAYDGLELTFDDLPNVIRQSNFLQRSRDHMRMMQMHMQPSPADTP